MACQVPQQTVYIPGISTLWDLRWTLPSFPQLHTLTFWGSLPGLLGFSLKSCGSPTGPTTLAFCMLLKAASHGWCSGLLSVRATARPLWAMKMKWPVSAWMADHGQMSLGKSIVWMALLEQGSQESSQIKDVYFCNLGPAIGGSCWFLRCPKASFFLSLCKVFRFFLMVLISSAINHTSFGLKLASRSKLKFFNFSFLFLNLNSYYKSD